MSKPLKSRYNEVDVVKLGKKVWRLKTLLTRSVSDFMIPLQFQEFLVCSRAGHEAILDVYIIETVYWQVVLFRNLRPICLIS